jgi:general secretion pathway protein A
MYKSFFHLVRNPFDLSPDPSYFVGTKWHNEALVNLYYGVRCHKGFIVVTGEVGTGKTLLLRCLLKLLKESEDIAYSYVFNGKLTPTEFLQYILSDFDVPASGKNKCELLIDIGKLLISREAKKQTTVLIVDEAHLLSEDLLDEIRLLSNLETAEETLLQIVLVGQPELNEKLDSVAMRQLKQRIALRANLSPLGMLETAEYIAKRLEVASSHSREEAIFSAEAIETIFRYSHGLPRLINTICENALITAYAQQVRIVTPGIVDDVARNFHLDM